MNRTSLIQRRKIDGLLLLDKPAGLSSNAALQQVKRYYKAQKAGHTGALDPLATGMLPICLGQATKFSQFLLTAHKRYQVTAKLGLRTDTSDAEGKIINERLVNVSIKELIQVLSHFRGVSDQVPSIYSALKHQGKPLYHYARRGIEVPRKVRTITVYQLDLIEFLGEQLILEIYCSKGTYIRTLIDDLGEMLGCGAHVTALRRLSIADHLPASMVSLEQIERLAAIQDRGAESVVTQLDKLLLPMECLVARLPVLTLDPATALRLRQGRAVPLVQSGLNGLVRLTVGSGHLFIGIGAVLGDQVVPKRLVATEIDLLQTSS